MLIKTEKFDEFLHKVLPQISVNRARPPIIVGSYKIKPYKSVITDIDMTDTIFASPSLITRLSDILDTIERTKTFFFIRLHCGVYEEFIPPWTVDGDGGCYYSQEEAEQWYKKLKKDKLLPPETLSFVKNKIFSDTMVIKDLFDIKKELTPYSEIFWTKTEIKAGRKEFNGKVYDLIDQIRKGYSGVMKYLLHYRVGDKDEYCSIDDGILDKKFYKERQNLHSYYEKDDYQIFKSYKWYLDKESETFKKYVKVFSKFEAYNALINRIKIVDKIRKYNLSVSDSELIRDCAIWAKTLNVSYDPTNPDKSIKELKTHIINIVNKYKSYFRGKIQKRFLPMIELFEARIREANIPVNKREMVARMERGVKCPFFELDIEDSKKIYNTAKRALVQTDSFIKCLKKASEIFEIPIPLLFDTIIQKNKLSIVRKDDGYILLDGGKELGVYKKADKKSLQIRVLTGKVKMKKETHSKKRTK